MESTPHPETARQASEVLVQWLRRPRHVVEEFTQRHLTAEEVAAWTMWEEKGVVVFAPGYFSGQKYLVHKKKVTIYQPTMGSWEKALRRARRGLWRR
jgi:hypothetical protein